MNRALRLVLFKHTQHTLQKYFEEIHDTCLDALGRKMEDSVYTHVFFGISSSSSFSFFFLFLSAFAATTGGLATGARTNKANVTGGIQIGRAHELQSRP